MTAVIYAIVGLVVVLLTSLLKKEHWSTKTNQVLATVLSTLGGLVTIYLKNGGSATLSNTVEHSAILLAVAQLIYSLGLKDTSINAYITSLNLFGAGVKSDKSVEEAIAQVAVAAKKTTKKASVKK
jgi:biotin transporter BioY